MPVYMIAHAAQYAGFCQIRSHLAFLVTDLPRDELLQLGERVDATLRLCIGTLTH